MRMFSLAEKYRRCAYPSPVFDGAAEEEIFVS
jgi:hypothetical protein